MCLKKAYYEIKAKVCTFAITTRAFTLYTYVVHAVLAQRYTGEYSHYRNELFSFRYFYCPAMVDNPRFYRGKQKALVKIRTAS